MSSTQLAQHIPFVYSSALRYVCPTFWDHHVNSEVFDRGCDAKSKRLSSSSPGSECSEHFNLYDSNDASSFTSQHDVPKFEAYLYYCGLRGDRKRGPKLVFRTSTDILPPPSGPFQEVRTIQLLTVHEHAKLDQENLWPTIRDKTVKILDDKQIRHTSVDLVRFRWEERIKGSSCKTVTSRVTIWVGVLPDSTSGDAAFDSAQDILKLLKEHDIDDFDIAYRESKARPLAGPTLYAPVDEFDPLKSVIDWVTTSLSLPIAGLKTLNMQGALGFYFKVGADLYGVTARHVLFPDTEGNELYRYSTSAPEKKVVLMGNGAFQDLLESTQTLIGDLRINSTLWEQSVKKREGRVADGDQKAAAEVAKYQQMLQEARDTIAELKIFFATLKKDWSDVEKRVIGHVVWAPPITGLTPPYGYTRDVCVIKLDKQKFLPNLRGNAVDLGTEIGIGQLMRRLDPRIGVSREFHYPVDRMYLLKTILAAANIREPDKKDNKGDPTRFVMKRGPATLTTIGRLNGYESHQRRYTLFGNFDSVEAAVLPYDNEPGPFARRGDSGAAIVGTHNDLVAQLTGGAGPTDAPDIIYGTPMEWLWNDVIKAEFPNAVLFFDGPGDH